MNRLQILFLVTALIGLGLLSRFIAFPPPDPTRPQADSDSGLTAARYIAEGLVKQQLRDPDSAEFGEIDAHNDRKWRGHKVTFVCGSVNSKNGFGGYAGYKNFVYIKDYFTLVIDPGINNGHFVSVWNSLCAGKHHSS